MGKKKFYAVKKGVKPGIYESWEECKKNIEGISNALYKGFTRLEEANSYLEEDRQKVITIKDNSKENDNREKLVSEKIAEYLDEGRVVAFTDGGFDSDSKIAGYGVYILQPNDLKAVEISEVVLTKKFENSNNITPEVMAVKNAFDWAVSNNYDKIAIFHDYSGIGKWGRKEWKAKSGIAKWFVEKVDSIYTDILDIKYIWVPGHSNITYNEEADRLATEAINKNLKPSFTMSETYFTCKNVVEKDVIEIINTLKLIPGLTVSESNIVQGKKVYHLSIEKEKLTVSFYRQKSITLIQGKPNSLFSLFISYYTEKISEFNLVKAYAEMYKKKINLHDVNSMVERLNLPDDFPIDAKKLLMQAFSEKIALTKKNLDAYDFSHYVFPACRALEGTIKYLFEKSGTHISSANMIGNYYDKDSRGIYILKGKNNRDKIYKNKLEETYNVYNRNRHTIGHFGELIFNQEHDSTTRILVSSEEAIDVIEEILDAIKFD